MADPTTYDVKNYLITAAGVPIEGYADDEAFSIEWDEDWWTDKTGADGFFVRSHKNDRRAKITIKLMQTSGSNGHLARLLMADELANPHTNAPQFLLTIKNLVPGGASYIAKGCFIMKPPTISGGREAGTREWVIRCPDLVMDVVAAEA